MHEDRYYLKDRLALLRISRGAEILPRSTYHDRDRELLRNSCLLWVCKLTHHSVKSPRPRVEPRTRQYRRVQGTLSLWPVNLLYVRSIDLPGDAAASYPVKRRIAMKYIRFAVVLAALIPSQVYAQNTQFSDCRTLEAAGNNIGPDEAFVNGMVCKVVKPKASPSVSTPASGKTAETENRQALLGIVEPETLRSKLNADANPAGKVATPRTGTEPEPETEPRANVTPQSARFEMKHNASLGDIARAYQKNSQVQAASVAEDIVGPKKPSIEAAPTAAAKTTAPETATTAPLQLGQKANALTATQAQAPTPAVMPEATPAAITPTLVTPTEPQPAAKTEAFAAPQAAVSAEKAETNLPAVVATPVATPEPQAAAKTEAFAAPQTPVAAEKAETNPPAFMTAPVTTPERQTDGNTE